MKGRDKHEKVKKREGTDDHLNLSLIQASVRQCMLEFMVRWHRHVVVIGGLGMAFYADLREIFIV